MAFIAVWLRLSHLRQLDWYRNSSHQSKDIAHVQKVVAQRMADKVRPFKCSTLLALWYPNQLKYLLLLHGSCPNFSRLEMRSLTGLRLAKLLTLLARIRCEDLPNMIVTYVQVMAFLGSVRRPDRRLEAQQLWPPYITEICVCPESASVSFQCRQEQRPVPRTGSLPEWQCPICLGVEEMATPSGWGFSTS